MSCGDTIDYERINRELFQAVRESDFESNDLDSLIDEFEMMPEPKGKLAYSQLAQSRLNITIPNLVHKLGRESKNRGKGSEKSTQRLIRLWRKSRSLGLQMNSRAIATYVLSCVAEKTPTASEFLVYELAEEVPRLRITPDEFEWYPSETRDIEIVFATEAQKTIDGRDDVRLRQCLLALPHLGINFQHFNWGDFATRVKLTSKRTLFEALWSCASSSTAMFGDGTWVSFASACATMKCSDVLHEIWDHASRSRAPLSSPVAGALAHACGKWHETKLLESIWSAVTAKAVENFNDATWGAFIHAAANCQDSVLTQEIWNERIRRYSAFLSTAGDAAADCGSVQLFREVWDCAEPLVDEFSLKSFGSFAAAAASLGLADTIRELFRAWNPSADSLINGEHGVWAAFLKGALHAKDEQLFIELFRELECRYDPVRFTDRGTLQLPLRRAAEKIRDVDIRREVLDALHGRSCDVERCLGILATEGIDVPILRGAGRCLMRWLYCSYFEETPEEFRMRVRSVARTFSSMKHSHRSIALHSLVTQGQRSLNGCVKALFFRTYHNRFSALLHLDDKQWAARISDGSVSSALAEFHEKDLFNLIAPPSSRESIPDGSPAQRLQQLSSFIRKNQREYLIGKKRGGEDFFAQSSKLIEDAFVEALGEEDWILWLQVFVHEMAKEVSNALKSPIANDLHNAKREFIRVFQTPLSVPGLELEEAQSLAEGAREFVLNVPASLPEHRVGEAREVNIAREVWKEMVRGREHLPTTTVEPAEMTNFRIAAWDGAKNDLIIPMLRELRINADAAMAALPSDRQIYRVRLEHEELDIGKMGMLTVENACAPRGERPSYSTGRGLKLVSRCASLLNFGGIRGFVVPTQSPPSATQPMFAVRVYFPLYGDMETHGDDATAE